MTKLPSPGPAAVVVKKGHRPLLAQNNPKREKYCYEYLVKFKGMSYVKTKWLTFHQIGKKAVRVGKVGGRGGRTCVVLTVLSTCSSYPQSAWVPGASRRLVAG